MQNNPNIDATRIKGRLQLDESSTTEASLNLKPGTAPATKTSGDVFAESDRLKFVKSDLSVNTMAFLSDVAVDPAIVQRAINMAAYRF